MLSQLDNIIFPDSCEVFEVSSQRYVYPIYKNGYSSLSNCGFKVLHNTMLSKLDMVEIFVRDPIERFASGLDTWIRYNSHLDKDTLIALAGNHLFLNRHYAPQFHWLVNLRRFTNAKIKINSIQDLSSVTRLHLNESKNKIHLDLNNYPKVAFYLQLDKVLTEDLLGKTVSFKLIVQTIKSRYPDVYEEVVQRSINICNVLG